MQMVLGYLGWTAAGGVNNQRLQNSWLDQARAVPLLSGEDLWMCPPTGLQRTLSSEVKKLPPPQANILPATAVTNVSGTQAEETVTRGIVWSLFNNRMPAVVLTLLYEPNPPYVHSDHWIVVVGCSTDNDPLNATDPAYKVLTVEFHNPWVPAAAAQPPTKPPQHTTYRGWRTRYLAPSDRAPYVGTVVAVVGT